MEAAASDVSSPGIRRQVQAFGQEHPRVQLTKRTLADALVTTRRDRVFYGVLKSFSAFALQF